MPLVIFLTLAVFLALGLDKDPQKLPSALINKPLPVFKLIRADINMFAHG